MVNASERLGVKMEHQFVRLFRPALNKSHFPRHISIEENGNHDFAQIPNTDRTQLFFDMHWNEVVIAKGAQGVQVRNLSFLSSIQRNLKEFIQ